MELRKQPRVRIAFPAVACVGETAISVDAVDMSSVGIAVTSDRRLVLGSDVRVSWFSGDGTPAEVDAMVVRVEKMSSSTWLWGLAVMASSPRIDPRKADARNAQEDLMQTNLPALFGAGGR